MPEQFHMRTMVLKVETTYGTFETMSGPNAGQKVMDPDLKHAGAWIERLKSDGTLGTDVGAIGPVSSALTFKTYMHGDGSSGDPSWAAQLFPCVGMPSNTTNSYQTAGGTNANWKGLSAAIIRGQGGLRRAMRGGMGNLTMTLERGMPVLCDWNFVGGFQAVRSDTAQLTGISFEDVTPPKFSGASSFTLDGSTTVATKISKAVINLNNAPALRADPNAIGGYIGGWIGNPKPTITLDPEAVAISSKDWETLMQTADVLDMIFVATDGGAGTVTITCTNCQQNRMPEDQEREGILVDALNFNVNGTVTVLFGA